MRKYPTLETCLELQKAGVNIETEKYWHKDDNGNVMVLTLQEALNKPYFVYRLCPAPDFSELFDALPKIMNTNEGFRHFCISPFLSFTDMYSAYIGYSRNSGSIDFSKGKIILCKPKSITQAAAELLLILKKDNYA